MLVKVTFLTHSTGVESGGGGGGGGQGEGGHVSPTFNPTFLFST